MLELPYEKRRRINTGLLWLVFMLAWIGFMLWNSGAVACPDSMAARVDAAILWLVTPPETASAETVRRLSESRVAEDHGYRQELAGHFIEAAEHFDLPLWSLVAIGYTESVFRMGEVGDGGRSHGIMQVGRQGRLACREHCGDMGTARQQIFCGACWLDRGRQWCGDLDGGMAAYVGGHCRLRTPGAARAHAKKQKVAAKLAEKFSGGM